MTRFLDDYLGICASEQASLACMSRTAQVLRDFGLMVNPGKTEGPSQSIEFLGLWLDQTVSVPEDKMREAKELLRSFSARSSASRKSILSLIGKLSFIASVLPAARPFLRFLLDSAPGFRRRLPTGFKDDIALWLKFLDSWNGTRRWTLQQEPVVLASDASTQGMGFVVERAPDSDSINALLPANLRQGSPTGCQWSDTHARLRSSRHIAEAELLAPVTFALEAGPALRGDHVVFVMDNSADVATINRRKTNSKELLFLRSYAASRWQRLKWASRSRQFTAPDFAICFRISCPGRQTMASQSSHLLQSPTFATKWTSRKPSWTPSRSPPPRSPVLTDLSSSQTLSRTSRLLSLCFTLLLSVCVVAILSIAPRSAGSFSQLRQVLSGSSPRFMLDGGLKTLPESPQDTANGLRSAGTGPASFVGARS